MFIWWVKGGVNRVSFRGYLVRGTYVYLGVEGVMKQDFILGLRINMTILIPI